MNDNGDTTTTTDPLTHSHHEVAGAEAAVDRHQPTDLQELSKKVMKKATSSKKFNKLSTALSQLALESRTLHGREDHLQLLKSKLRDFAGKANTSTTDKSNKAEVHQPELLLVAGLSGTGKTALVKKGLEEPAEKMGLTFVEGKFGLNKHSALPLSAFSEAMSNLTQSVMDSDKVQVIQKDLKAAFQDHEIVGIVDALPGCEGLFTSGGEENANGQITDTGSEVQVGEKEERRFSIRSSFVIKRRQCSIRSVKRIPSFGGKEAVQRLQYAICVMLKVICSNLKGLVLFIDDLQWSDVGTIELLRSLLIRKNEIPSLLIVGAYREDEVSQSHPLMLQLKDNEDCGIKTTTLEVGNLNQDSVLTLIAEVLRMDGHDDAVSTLATTIYKKTDGVAFYVLVFLKSIYDEDMLQFNFGTMRWHWDDDAVKERLITENVTTIMINKLKRYDETAQTILSVASCLGTTFSMSTVAKIAESILSPDDKTEQVSDIFAKFEADGLFEMKGSSSIFRFIHDQVQEAAFTLIPADKRDTFRGEIGATLMKKMNPKELEENLFVVVGLRNCAKAFITSVSERQELARMNLTAGLMASGNAAFDVSIAFYRTGRNLLGESGWETDADIMVQLCSNEAKACFITGDLDTMNKLVDKVLGTNASVDDKFMVYEVKIRAANSAQRFDEALNTAIDVRHLLGLTSPSNKPSSPLLFIKELIKTSRMLGKRTAEDIVNLPLIEDPHIAMGQQMIDLMCSAAVFGQPTIYPLLVFLQVRTSIKYGINKSSCNAFATYGVLLCGALGKFDRGREMAKAVEMLLENPDYRSMQSMSIMLCENMIYHWTSPLQATLAPLLSGYQKGLETGDLQGAGYNIGVRSVNLWYAGRQLDGLLAELETNVSVLIRMNEATQKYGVFAQIVAVKQLQGTSCEGDEIQSLDEILTVASETGNGGLHGHVVIAQLDLFVIFQDWDSALALIKKSGKVRQEAFGAYGCVRFSVLEALISLQGVRRSKSWMEKKKWKKRAKKTMKLIGSWLKKGNVNVVGWNHLLMAELHAIQGESAQAKEEYKSAITVATKNGFLHDRAIAHEHASQFYLREKDTYWAKYHLEKAEVSFGDWGATAKAKQVADQRKTFGES